MLLDTFAVDAHLQLSVHCECNAHSRVKMRTAGFPGHEDAEKDTGAPAEVDGEVGAILQIRAE